MSCRARLTAEQQRAMSFDDIAALAVIEAHSSVNGVCIAQASDLAEFAGMVTASIERSIVRLVSLGVVRWYETRRGALWMVVNDLEGSLSLPSPAAVPVVAKSERHGGLPIAGAAAGALVGAGA